MYSRKCFFVFAVFLFAASSQAQTFDEGKLIDETTIIMTTGTLADSTREGTVTAVTNSGATRGVRSVDMQSTRSATARVASGNYSVISGGSENTASGTYSTVSGGDQNTASGFYATVGGGNLSKATGNFSYAIGRRSVASAAGAFMLSDDTNSTKTNSVASSIAFDFAGGYDFRSGPTTFTGSVYFVELDAEKYLLHGDDLIEHSSGEEFVDYAAPGHSGARFLTPVFIMGDVSATTGTVFSQGSVVAKDGDFAIGDIISFSDAPADMGALRLGHARGTSGTATAIKAGYSIGGLQFLGYGSQFGVGAEIRAVAPEDWSGTGDRPTRLGIFIAADGGTAKERLRLSANSFFYLPTDTMHTTTSAPRIGPFEIANESAVARYVAITYSTTANEGAELILARSRSTNHGVGGAIGPGDLIASIKANSWDGTDMDTTGGVFVFEADGIWGPSDAPTKLTIQLAPDGSATLVDVAIFNSDETIEFSDTVTIGNDLHVVDTVTIGADLFTTGTIEATDEIIVGADLRVQYSSLIETILSTDSAGGFLIDPDGAITTVTGSLIAGSIVSGDTIAAGSGTSVNEFSIDDTLAGDSDDVLVTEHAIKTYVDGVVTAADLDFAGGSGTGTVDLDSQTFTLSGTANEVDTSASGQTITIGLPNSVDIATALTAETIAADTTLSTLAGTITGIYTGGAQFNAKYGGTTETLFTTAKSGLFTLGLSGAADMEIGGSLALDDDLTVDGVMRVNGGDLTVDSGDVVINSGDVLLSEGQVVATWESGAQIELVHSGANRMLITVDSGGDATLATSGNGFITQNAIDSATGVQILDANGGIPIGNWDTENERLGIRIAAPVSTLHISGDRSVTGGIMVEENSTDEQRLAFYAVGGNAANISLLAATETLNIYDEDDAITIATFVSSTKRMGVGPDIPEARLHVVDSNAAAPTVIIENGGGSQQLDLVYDGSNKASFTVDSDGDLQIDPSGDHVYVFDDIGEITGGFGAAFVVGNATTNTHFVYGQSAAAGLTGSHVYNATPANSTDFINTLGYNTPLSIDASEIILGSPDLSDAFIGIGTSITTVDAKLHVRDRQASGYTVCIENLGHAQDAIPLKIRGSVDNPGGGGGPDVIIMDFFDGDNDFLGAIHYNTAQALHFESPSDEILKGGITTSTVDSRARIMRTRIARFFWNTDPDTIIEAGIVAQDLAKQFPGMVSTRRIKYWGGPELIGKHGYTTETVIVRKNFRTPKTKVVWDDPTSRSVIVDNGETTHTETVWSEPTSRTIRVAGWDDNWTTHSEVRHGIDTEIMSISPTGLIPHLMIAIQQQERDIRQLKVQTQQQWAAIIAVLSALVALLKWARGGAAPAQAVLEQIEALKQQIEER